MSDNQHRSSDDALHTSIFRTVFSDDQLDRARRRAEAERAIAEFEPLADIGSVATSSGARPMLMHGTRDLDRQDEELAFLVTPSW